MCRVKRRQAELETLKPSGRDAGRPLLIRRPPMDERLDARSIRRRADEFYARGLQSGLDVQECLDPALRDAFNHLKALDRLNAYPDLSANF